MVFTLGSRTISTVAVIGSGQIGPDIALHFAKVLHPHGVAVVVVDVSQPALDAGQARTHKKIDKGAESGAFKPAQAAAMKAAIRFTADYAQIAGAQLVVEAATEDEALKARIFKQVEALVAADAVLLSNSSHLEPERIFAGLQHNGRSAVAHYFFPAERNVVVEVVAGAATDPVLQQWLLQFYEAIGKVAIPVKSRYGYAVDPIFEGVFAAACLCVQEGMGTVKEVDFAARAALGMTVGPFTAMNLTGGNPITHHGLSLMQTRFATPAHPTPWFAVPALLAEKLAAEGPAGKWAVCGRGETADVEPERRDRIHAALHGAYLGICFGLIDTGIITAADFELAIELALDQKGPLRMANELGVTRAQQLVRDYVAAHPTLAMPRSLVDASDPLPIATVIAQDVMVEGGVVRVLTIRRPKVLNALNAATFGQIRASIDAANLDPAVRGVVLTGHGGKAFVSGADIGALAAVRVPADGRALAELGQSVCRAIELSAKPIVAALNGLAFGGGLELALACHARMAVAGVRALAGLPEVNLGIIPGAGGTQRLPRLVGLQRGLAMLRTAQTLSSEEALAAGLVRSLHPADQLLAAAVQLAAAAGAGQTALPRLAEGPLDEAAVAPACDVGHRSQAVDALLCEVVLTGARHGLQAGLAAELDGFERICALQDMRIGIDTFVQHGPKMLPAFVHA